jgi:hypothetical protein
MATSVQGATQLKHTTIFHRIGALTRTNAPVKVRPTQHLQEQFFSKEKHTMWLCKGCVTVKKFFLF